MLTWETLNALFLTILPRMEWLVIAIILDLILGIAVALKMHEFQWQLVADFLESYGLKALGWLTLEVLAIFPKELTGGIILEGAAWIAYIAIVASVLGSILGHIEMVGIVQKKIGFLMERLGLPPTYVDVKDDK